MGFFDILKRNRNNEKFETQLPYTIGINKEGKTQVDYTDTQSKHAHLYDTTRIIIDYVQGNLAKCRVSWYGRDDAVMLDGIGNEISRATDYSKIITKIDFELLQRDPNYVQSLMCKLLDRNRVDKYLERGLQDNPDNPCGNYIGSIEKREDGYIKFFDSNIGLQIHNSPEMRNKRQDYKEQKLQNLRDRLKIENLNAKIALNEVQKIKEEIDKELGDE